MGDEILALEVSSNGVWIHEFTTVLMGYMYANSCYQ